MPLCISIHESEFFHFKNYHLLQPKTIAVNFVFVSFKIYFNFNSLHYTKSVCNASKYLCQTHISIYRPDTECHTERKWN